MPRRAAQATPLQWKGSENLGLFSNKKAKKEEAGVAAVQTSAQSRHPYSLLSSYAPLGMNGRIYASLRESVPLIDSAVLKIIRLVNDFRFETGNEKTDGQINAFFDEINVGGNQTGISAFVSCYLSQLLTYGSAVGEMIADDRGLYALYNGELEALEVKRAPNGLGIEFYNSGTKIENQELILFSALNPKAGEILGTSLLSGLPFISDILLTVYNTIGENWKHAGNLRYAVTYKPNGDMSDARLAKERAQEIGRAWQEAMSCTDAVKDFVAVGDVSVKVIGADNNVLSSEIPVRQLLEQIVAKTGIPPYMLGLSWSTTERMSVQQADMFTTELRAYRKILTPVLLKIANKYAQINGIYTPIKVSWNEILLQDETEHARARLYNAQADSILKEVSD